MVNVPMEGRQMSFRITVMSLPVVLAWVLQRNRTNRVCISLPGKKFVIRCWLMGLWGWEVPLPAIWELEDGQQCSSKTREPESQGREADVPAQRQAGQVQPPSTFGSLQASVRWVLPAHIGEGCLLYSVHRFKCRSFSTSPSSPRP